MKVLAVLLAILATAQDHRREIQTPPTNDPLHIALSPNGSEMVTWASSAKGLTLWLRSLESSDGRLIYGSESDKDGKTGFPFWSPDGRSIAYFGDGKLRRIDPAGGQPWSLCDAPQGKGGTWSRGDVILFAPSNRGPLFRISASGGMPTPATELDRSRYEIGHLYPWFLPDGMHFLYLAISSKKENSGIWEGSIDSPDRTFLVSTQSKGVFAPPGDLLFMNGTTLMARHFDPYSIAFTGPAFPVAKDIGVNSNNNAAGFTASETGTLAYRADRPQRADRSPVTVVENWRWLDVR